MLNSFQVKPLEYPDRICTPSPEPVRKSRKTNSHRGTSAPSTTRRQRQPSLSTITEEPGSWDSTTHEIVVEPELIVETTTFTQPHSQVLCLIFFELKLKDCSGTVINLNRWCCRLAHLVILAGTRMKVLVIRLQLACIGWLRIRRVRLQLPVTLPRKWRLLLNSRWKCIRQYTVLSNEAIVVIVTVVGDVIQRARHQLHRLNVLWNINSMSKCNNWGSVRRREKYHDSMSLTHSFWLFVTGWKHFYCYQLGKFFNEIFLN